MELTGDGIRNSSNNKCMYGSSDTIILDRDESSGTVLDQEQAVVLTRRSADLSSFFDRRHGQKTHITGSSHLLPYRLTSHCLEQ